MDSQHIQFIMDLRRRGITDSRVLAALERTPREDFLSPEFRHNAYKDCALPLSCGQTLSQPSLVALMTEALKPDDRCKILEIGTGSGFQTAVLSRLARRVYTIERYSTLLRQAEKRFHDMGLNNIVTRLGDGREGWEEQAPFDRILLTAATPRRPDTLLKQLKNPGGILIAPVGPDNNPQLLMRYRYEGEILHEDCLEKVRFVPLMAGIPQGQGDLRDPASS